MQNDHRDVITIIARTSDQAIRQFHERGLAKQGYSITSAVERHSFSVVSDDGADTLFAGERMYAATFVRAGQAKQ